MPPHRSLNFTTFVNGISPEVLRQYLEHFPWEKQPSEWAHINADELRRFLDAPENERFRATVTEDLRRMNDLCGAGANLLVQAYKRSGRAMPNDKSTQECAMSLFVEDRHAFEYAWSRYLMFGGSPKLSVYPLALHNGRIGAKQAKAFERSIATWFGQDGKGECELRRFDEGDETVFLISRGSYLRTVAFWQGGQVSFMSFRPASEDVLAYDRKIGQLTIKASLRKDRDHYLKAFAAHVARDGQLAEAAAMGTIFSLQPLQDGTFDFAGDDVIMSIDLLKVRLHMNDQENAAIEISSQDVRRTMDRYRYSLDEGQVVFARFRFNLSPPGEKPVRVTFEIEPPARTDLAQKRYAEIIQAYLSEQRVKLA